MTPTRNMWLALVAAVGVLVGSIGFAVGAALAKPSKPAADSVDAGFLQDMTDHHSQAVQMSILEMRHGENETVKTFAREILYQQAYEIGAMERQLEAWNISRQDRPAKAMVWMGHAASPTAMPGMATDTEFDALGDARGADEDALFVRLMQDHHRGGIDMAEYAAEHAKSAFVRDIAARMARVQTLEISEMEGALKRFGLNANPAGWTPGPFDSAASTDDGEEHGH